MAGDFTSHHPSCDTNRCRRIITATKKTIPRGATRGPNKSIWSQVCKEAIRALIYFFSHTLQRIWPLTRPPLPGGVRSVSREVPQPQPKPDVLVPQLRSSHYCYRCQPMCETALRIREAFDLNIFVVVLATQFSLETSRLVLWITELRRIPWTTCSSLPSPRGPSTAPKCGWGCATSAGHPSPLLCR